jgi:hypothetical protein
MMRFTALPELVLGPLAGRPDSDWYRAPSGKWSPVQIVQHLALGIELSGRTLDSRRAREPMRRRPRSAIELGAYALLFGLGWLPSGRKAPAATLPAVHPDRREVERAFRDGVDRFLRLEQELLPARRADLFARHPVFGDLTLPEWLRFHVWHCGHHARQIRARLAG